MKIKTLIIGAVGVVTACIIGKVTGELLEPQSVYGVPDGYDDNLTAQRVFNSRFLEFKGTSVEASQVRILINTIDSNNVVYEANNVSDEKYVHYTGPEAKEIKPTKTYVIECVISPETGYVCEIIVTENEQETVNKIEE